MTSSFVPPSKSIAPPFKLDHPPMELTKFYALNFSRVKIAHQTPVQTWTVRVASSICSSAVEETRVQVEHDKNKLAAEVVILEL
ncbi:hypothetical protein NC651_032067 [Populus alba x Populus x berolinensis]|nr:hypothetical protein NC651_032067 [Populus alba x Populus x berolinensis]